VHLVHLTLNDDFLTVLPVLWTTSSQRGAKTSLDRISLTVLLCKIMT